MDEGTRCRGREWAGFEDGESEIEKGMKKTENRWTDKKNTQVD